MGSMTTASTLSAPSRAMVPCKALRLLEAATCALGERKVSGAGIFSEETVIAPHSDGAFTSPFMASVCSVAPW